MKRIKGIRKTTHKLILEAVKDYYGQYDVSIKKVAEFLFGQKVELTKEEKADAWCIRQNLEDEVYIKNLA